MNQVKDIIDILRQRKNVILQGAPGTGKTWLIPEIVTRLCGVLDPASADDANRAEVIKQYGELLKTGRVVFTTFHPSFDYDDFVEGWKPRENGTLCVEPGLFRKLCQAADKMVGVESSGINVWAVSLGGRQKNPVHDDCLKNGRIRVAFKPKKDEEIQVIAKGGQGEPTMLRQFYNEMKPGDYVVVPRDDFSIDAVGRILESKDPKNPVEWIEDGVVCGNEGYECPRSRPVEWLWQGKPTQILPKTGKGFARFTVSAPSGLTPEKIWDFVRKQVSDTAYVLVIDEINRGNIAKIFGELITLLEPDKRADGLTKTMVTLPYSQKPFSVPSNVYVIGTMNTADRSIGNIDYALRRRFSFYQMKAHKLDPKKFNTNLFDDVRKIFYEEGSDRPNRECLSAEFRPEDVMPGQSYFLLEGDDKEEKQAQAKQRFTYELKPLLEEYLYDGILTPAAREKIDELKPYTERQSDLCFE